MMTIAEFEDLVDLHGPDPELWRAADRPRAAALLAQSDAARVVLSQARLSEQALTAMPLDRAGAELRRAILAIPNTAPAGRPARVTNRRLPFAGAGLPGRSPAFAGGSRAVWAGGIPAALVSGLAAAVVGIVLGVHGVSPLALPSSDGRASATTEYMKAMTEIDTEIGQ
ncbi:hypothetical protein UAJ10_22925 [Nitrospirillum sp. BR 11164]|uniref:hypothetical protein n=1 Tax=Nitrospirillum sp. BR 11164 TaxID=3104324 RepID=UPI002B002123|nr:hypothetical protein [Nitrospirillum sp. BR 11164]MEA1651855.1 hypothetical protein [Nitrospirillum sp. BR 11164]